MRKNSDVAPIILIAAGVFVFGALGCGGGGGGAGGEACPGSSTECGAAAECPAQTTACVSNTCPVGGGCCGAVNAARGAACSDSGGVVCDGNGACVAAHCGDGLKDADETDVDCGGSCGATCVVGWACEHGADCTTNLCLDGVCSLEAPGSECTLATECASGFCVDGVCCDAACGGACQACTHALTGAESGVCAAITAGLPDPASSCLACDGHGACEGIPTLDGCALQASPGSSLTLGGAFTASGQALVSGVTDPAGAGAGLDGQLGIGAAGTDGSTDASWTWIAGSYHGDAGTSDEWQAQTTPAAAGSYEYAYRFRYQSGPWTYCDLDGTANGYAREQQGTLTVSTPSPPTIDFCVLHWPPSGDVETGTPLTVYGQVFESGVTDGPGQGAQVEAQLGHGAADVDGSLDGSWTWTTAAFDADVDGLDEYRADLEPGAGNYGYAYRFRYQEGPWTYCDLDGSANGHAQAQQGVLTVTDPAPPWALLHALASPVENAGSQVRVSGEVHLAGVTDAAGPGAGISADVGIGARGSVPTDASWSWTAAAYAGDAAGGGVMLDDVYAGWLTAPAAGSYDVAMRFHHGGQDVYADLDGGSAEYQPAQADRLTTFAGATNGIGWCNVQYPPSTTAAVGTTTELIYGQVWVPGETGNIGAGAGVVAQVGVGGDASDPRSARWAWFDATFQGDAGNNDEYRAALTAPATAGTYRYVYRFRYQAGWAYCDTVGSFDPTRAGTLTVH